MSSSLHRRILIAATAGLACLVPVACDAAAASPSSSAYHRPTATKKPGHKPGSGHGHGATTSASATADPTADPTGTADPTADPTGTVDPTATGDPAATTTTTTTAAPTSAPNNGLQVLARDCSQSALQPHTGFQIAPACVSTAAGEVAAQDKDPSLLITDAPTEIAAKTPFTISVSTRNLVRDRFLGAAAGGYYLESSVLTAGGLQRGHFHTACRILGSTTEAPDPAPVPAFFKATEDGGGGSTPDTVQVQLTAGLPSAGLFQCAVWAGDGSHRTPMMQRANQTPAFDTVRIVVK